jgi:hypothetical protein
VAIVASETNAHPCFAEKAAFVGRGMGMLAPRPLVIPNVDDVPYALVSCETLAREI